MRLVLVLVLVLGACGKRGDRVVSASRDTVPITITTSYPGASPAVIAEAVTTPIERALGQAAKLEALHSRSSDGRSVVVAEFASGTDVDLATQEVQKAINAAMNLLPAELPTPPTYTKKAHAGAVLRLTLASKTLPLVEVADVASSLVAQKLSQVAGVGEVTVCGPEPETKITVDPVKLAALGKTIGDLREAIARANTTLPAGQIDANGTTLTVRTDTGTVEGLHRIPLVGDTSRIETTERGSCVAIATGNIRVVAVIVTPQVGADPLEVRERLEALVPKLAASLPVDLHVDVWPRTRPLAYEIELGSGMSLAARIDRLERALAALHLATRALVQFGDADRDPDLADLRIVPPEEHAQDLADDVALRFGPFNLTVLDRTDHIVGFSGSDVAELRKQADALVASLAKIKGLRVVDRLGGEEQPRMEIAIDRDTAARLGIAASEIASTLSVLAPGGTWVSTTFTQSNQYPVMLAVEGELPGVLDQVMLRSTTGSLVPVSAVAKVTATREPAAIFHEGQFPWIGVRIAGPLDALQDALAKLPVPATVRRDVREPSNR